MQEVWKPVLGYEGLYEVSDQGRIRGVDRVLSHGHRWKGREISPYLAGKGYLYADLYKDKKRSKVGVHVLVAVGFIGPRIAGTECAHANGMRTDNTALNLAWKTPANNQADKRAHGTHGIKFTAVDVERMFDLRRCGVPQHEIAAWFDTSESYLSRILSGKHWVHLGLAA